MKFNPCLEVVLASVVWGSTGVFVKYLNLPPTTIAFFRLAVPTLILGAFFLFKRTKLFHSKNKLILLASSLNAIRMFFYFVGFTFTSIGNAVIILYTWPIFATILSALFLKEKISKKNIVLLFITFFGIVLIYLNKEISFANKDFIGMSSMLLSAIIYSSTVVIFKKESNNYSKFETIFYQNLVGAIVFLPFIFINYPFPTIFQISVASIYAILIGLVGFGLFFSALKQIKASTASFLSYVEVISAILFGIILFNEVLTWNIVVGGLLIISSAIFIRKK
ncbi:MAG: DMT family transporter [Patescibacteria group bacterium]|nr:DMT family transporter [Patescibacteria group bacterium]